LKLRGLRLHIKAEVEALDRGEFAEVNEPDLESYFRRIGDRIRQWPDLTLNGAPSLTWARESRTGADSEEQWGPGDRRRYAALIATATRRAANDPEDRTTRRLLEARPRRQPEVQVRKPAHVLYYRAVSPGVVEIVRVLHEYMGSSRHIGEP
jgi:plasmid stabilization system protein ParE